MADIFTHSANTNRKRVYALSGFTVQARVSGWFFKRTDYDEPFKGPYSTEVSVALMIGRELAKELRRRDGLPN